MATTVTPAATASFQLGPFDTLTLSSGGARGSIALTSQAPKLCADQTLAPQSGTYGPWGVPMSVVMTITQGACDYTVNQYSVSGGGSYSDFNVDAIVSGMALPTSGGLSNNITAGVAYVTGNRVSFPGAAITLTASSDNYIDALPGGTYSVQAVANGAAAPAIAVNGLRLGYVVTGAAGPTAISSAVTTGKDSLGNWMGNTSTKRQCILGGANTTALTGGANTFIPFLAAAEQYDNAVMHDGAVNNTRITAVASGWYRASASATWAAGGGTIFATLRKNADVAIPGMETEVVANGGKTSVNVRSVPFFLAAGEYVQFRINAGNAITLQTANFALEQR